MRWIKIHGNMLSDDRLQHVLDEQRFAGIGLYYFMLQLVECQGEGAIAFNQVIGALERRYSRKKILRFIQDYDLFVLTEEGLVLSVDPIPGYTQEETEELRRSDAIDAVSRARVFARSHVSPGVHAHDTRAGVKEKRRKEKIRKEKSRGNTHFQKPSVEEVAAYCAERGNGIDAQHFLDFYEARGWKYGHTRSTDWKACECIEAAHEIPLVGIQTAEDVEEELWQLFRQGMQRGAAARIAGMDELITFETGRFNVHR